MGEPVSDSVVGVFTVDTPHGLHIRPAARLVSLVRRLGASAQMRNATTGSAWVRADSLSQVAGLGALGGHCVEVRADGPAAAMVVDAVLGYAGHGFGQVSDVPVAVLSSPGGAGIGVGPARHYRHSIAGVVERVSLDALAERERLDFARSTCRRDIAGLRFLVSGESAAIIDVQLQLLDDPGIVSAAEAGIAAGQSAEQAWSASVASAAAPLEEFKDEYQRARAADIRETGRTLLAALTGTPVERFESTGIMITANLTAAQAAQLDPRYTAGVVLAHSAPTDHAVILVRARGIPVVAAAGDWVLDIQPGITVVADGVTGVVIADPPADVVSDYRLRSQQLDAARAIARKRAHEPARTRAGIAVTVGATIGSIPEAIEAVSNGADGAVQVRTEFLFLNRSTAPGTDEQYLTYRDITDAADGCRVIIRTLDTGGDKSLPYLPVSSERNPMLGLRGIRYCLAHRDLFITQLLAIAQLARQTPLAVMFPMVSTLDELIGARSLFAEAIARTGTGRPAGLQVGMMVEVPAAALNIAQFVPVTDFVGIGTNDLTQYTFAAERGNDKVSALATADDPAILRLIGLVCAEHPQVTVCGELAASTGALSRMIAVGVRDLSVSPSVIPTVKDAIRQLDR